MSRALCSSASGTISKNSLDRDYMPEHRFEVAATRVRARKGCAILMSAQG